MSAGEFIDTNILVYAHDRSAEAKNEAARRLLTRLLDAGTGIVSTQVLMEFLVTTTRKIPKPLKISQASEIVSDFQTWRVFQPTVEDVVQGARIAEENDIHFWDAMIVRAAAETDAIVLWTEDLNDGQAYEGVTVRNPFA